MEKAKANNEEKNNKLNLVESNLGDLKVKLKRIELKSKRESEEDKKLIHQLRSRNEQILHEIKKKDHEINRIKEILRKSSSEKTFAKTVTF